MTHKPSDARRPALYGRRQGHRLRPGRARLLDERLPELRIDAPAPDVPPLDPLSAFAPGIRAVWLEIGFGAGEHLAAQASANPEVGILGCEPFVNGVAALLSRIDKLGLNNIRIYPDDAMGLIGNLAESSVARAFILFPDPWPKTRHHKRRLVQKPLLDALAHLLTDGAELRLATDHCGYARWIVNRCRRHEAFEWTARCARDWRVRPVDWPETRYEAKARGTGRAGVFLTFRRRPRG
jgi:tRNA (guanine-N7-)-methyltransferase